MCLILVAWRVREDYPLVVAANRDEFHARPAAPAAFWPDEPGVLAGRDLEAGGTWMGVSRAGAFAAVTNYAGGRRPDAAESRGALVSRFLRGTEPAADYVSRMAPGKDSYSGFNLLLARHGELWWLSNRDGDARRLDSGIYALGNLLLDSPDVAGHRARFGEAIATGPAMEPMFGVLAAARIVAPDYGTRCATLLLERNDAWLQYAERAFGADGTEGETVRYELRRDA